jgi:Ni/Co efflux regulator RcnB
MAIWQDLVDDHRFTRRQREREALPRAAARGGAARGAGGDHDRARRRGAGRLRRGADGAEPRDWQVPSDAVDRCRAAGCNTGDPQLLVVHETRAFPGSESQWREGQKWAKSERGLGILAEGT